MKPLIRKRYFYICNVFEASVKLQRNITTDSPAANGKVSRLCHAVRKFGGDVWIISLGRGRSKGTWKRYPATIRRIKGVPIVYLDFWDAPVLTHLVTIISLCSVVFHLTSRRAVLIFYNCMVHYPAALIMSKLLGRRCILDLEDGYRHDENKIRRILNLFLMKIHNFFCSSGTMLASTALKEQTSSKHTYICYGVSETQKIDLNWTTVPLQVLFGGSLFADTGAALLLDALDLLKRKFPEVLKQLNFAVTGFGDFSDHMQRAAMSDMRDFLTFHGNVTDKEYREIIRRSHVGLCLKLPSSSMGATTFPSKVVELSSNGLLILSTRVSDVPIIFDETTAVLLDEATPLALALALKSITENPDRAGKTALAGQERIAAMLSEEKIGRELLRFWQDDFQKAL